MRTMALQGNIQVVEDPRVQVMKAREEKEKFEKKIRELDNEIKKQEENKRLTNSKRFLRGRKKRGNAALIGGVITTIMMLVLGLIIIAYFYDAAPTPQDSVLNETFNKGKDMTQKTFNLAWLIPIGLVGAALVGFITKAFGNN